MLACAAIQTNAARLSTIIASEVILNKTSRRNTVLKKKREFLLPVVAKNDSGKKSIQPGVSGQIMGFGLG